MAKPRTTTTKPQQTRATGAAAAAAKAKPKTSAKPKRAARAKAAPEAESASNAGAARAEGGASQGARQPLDENYLDFLGRVFEDMSAGPWDPQRFDEMTHGVGMVLGSGPAFAMMESMFASTNAQSAVLMNAVQTQRQLDQVSLCCTSACVKQLLNLNNGQDAD